MEHQERPSSSNNIADESSDASTSAQIAVQEDEGEEENSGLRVERVRLSVSNFLPSHVDDVWSCVMILIAFFFFVSMTMILELFGSVKLQIGPNTSHLVHTNSFFVQSIKGQLVDESNPGPFLYGFYEPPPLDSAIKWTETHRVAIPVDLHREWIFFLNKGSKIDIFYSVNSSLLPLSLVIARGKESLLDWIEYPSYPNTTLSWNIIHGTGKIQQEIQKPAAYYIAVGNLNSEELQVDLKFRITSVIYNTAQAYDRCALGTVFCSLSLSLFGTNVAVLTSPGPQEGAAHSDWVVKLSYGPRWMTYLVGSGLMTGFILLLFVAGNTCQSSGSDVYQPAENPEPERAPLIPQKDDDGSSWGSSQDSESHNEDLDGYFAPMYGDGKSSIDGENSRRLCVICFDAPRDTFFLPCGHCAACFACGTRIVEEGRNCPICRRAMKKVRKIISV